MCASVTCSNGSGSGVLVPGTGVILNNMLGEEDLNPLGFHRDRAGAPGALDDGADRGPARRRDRARPRQRRLQPDPLGDPADGGARGRAGDAGARRRSRRRGCTSSRAIVQAEPGIDEEALARIEARGMPVARRPAINLFFGGVQAVARDPRQRRAERRRRPAPRRRRRLRLTGVPWRAMASRQIDFEAEGLLDGARGRGARGAAGAARAARRRRRAAGGAARGGRGRPPRPAAGRARARRRRRPLHGARSRRDRPASTSSCCGAFSAALGVPYPDPDEPLGDRGRPRGGAADRRRSSTPACPRRGCCRWRGRSGWGRRGSPRPTASWSSAP